MCSEILDKPRYEKLIYGNNNYTAALFRQWEACITLISVLTANYISLIGKTLPMCNYLYAADIKNIPVIWVEVISH